MHDGRTEAAGAPPVPLVKTGWSYAMWQWLDRRGLTRTVADAEREKNLPAGALFFLRGSVSWSRNEEIHHVGLVEGIDALERTAYTCEGNTDGSGTNEGGGVYRLERGLERIDCFAVYGTGEEGAEA